MHLESGTFGIFPAKLCRGRTPHEQIVLAWIWFYSNQHTGDAFPSIATLCRDTGMGRSKVILCINVLCNAGMLKKEPRFVDGHQTSNTYKVMMIPEPSTEQTGGSTGWTGRGPQDGRVGVHGVDPEPKEDEPKEEILGGVHKTDDFEPIEAVWNNKCGVVQYGRFRKAVKPVIETIGSDAAALCLSAYLAKVDPKFCSIEQFAKTFKMYLPSSRRPKGAY